MYLGTEFSPQFAAPIAQGSPFRSCILLGFGTDLRHLGFSYCRHISILYDAQHSHRGCVDRQSAMCNRITFSSIHFYGFYIQAVSDFAALLLQSTFVFFCISRHYSGLWLCWMAVSASASFQRLRRRTYFVFILAAQYVWRESYI